jgi:hypothetical protein
MWISHHIYQLCLLLVTYVTLFDNYLILSSATSFLSYIHTLDSTRRLTIPIPMSVPAPGIYWQEADLNDLRLLFVSQYLESFDRKDVL